MITGKDSNKVSPIKDEEKPLANPGDSTARELENLTNDKFTEYYLLAVIPIAFAFLEWVTHWSSAGNLRWGFTFIASIFTTFSIYKIYGLKKTAKSYKQGLEAEKSVGQGLEELRSAGAQVFHDIPADGFNIDHVVIDPTGIYVIETKSLGKIPEKNSKLIFDGKTLKINGKTLDRDPVAQVKACSVFIKELLGKSTGKTTTVKPVALFPGWWVTCVNQGNRGDAWVLNPKAFPKWIEKRPTILADDEVHMISMHLAMYVRDKMKAA